MENQVNTGDQNTQQIGQSPVSQPVQVPEKPEINFWTRRTILFIVLLFLLVGTGIGYLVRSFVQNRQDLQNQLNSIPVGTRVTTAIWNKSQSLAKSPNISIEFNPVGPNEDTGKQMWWISDNGYTFFIEPTQDTIVFRPSKVPNTMLYAGPADTLTKPSVKDFFNLAVSEFEKQGFIKNEKNSSSTFSDPKLWDYAQSYEKDGTKCTVTTSRYMISPQDSLDYGPQAVVTCVDWQENEYYTNQKPFLELLGIQDGAIRPSYANGGAPSGQNGAPFGNGDFSQVVFIYRDGRVPRRTIIKRIKDTVKQDYIYTKLFDSFENGENISCKLVKQYLIPEDIFAPCE